MLAYSSAIDLSTAHVRYLSRELATRRRQIGTRWRRLTAGRQALLALAHLRCGDTPPASGRGTPNAQLAAGFGIGIATVCRYIREAIEVPATRPNARRSDGDGSYEGVRNPRRHRAADRSHRRRPAPLLGQEAAPRHERPGSDRSSPSLRPGVPPGRLLWASPALPGATHDLTAAREHGIIAALAEAGLKCWADRACQGAARNVRVPFKGRRLKRWQRRYNTAHAKIRCVGEQAMTTLKRWRLLRELRCSTTRITSIVKAVLALHLVSA